MKSIFSIALLAGLTLAKHTQVMLLVDVTRLGPLSTNLPTMLGDAITSMLETGEYSFAVSSFGDKPAPYAGVGPFGDFPGPYREDYCYNNDLSFTSNAVDISKTLLALEQGSGLDAWENQFEAIIRGLVDEEVGWSNEDDKVVLLVTDSFGHSLALDTLAEHVLGFNEPVRCQGGSTRGGFGAVSGSWAISGWVIDQNKYKEYTELHYKRSCVADLTSQEQEKYDSLRKTFAIRQYPSVRDFNIDILKSDPDTHCRYHEYPFYEDVVNAAKERNASLFVLFHDPSNVSSNSYDDETIWTWALSDTWALAHMPNVWENIPDLTAISATSKGTLTDEDHSLESILVKGITALTTP